MAGEVVRVFANAPDGILIDATFGLGGHSKKIVSSLGGKFRIIGIDCDGEMIEKAAVALPEGITVFKMRFSSIPQLVAKQRLAPVSGIFFDLGLNSAQLDDASRGFSFSERGPIDMRFDRASGLPAREILSGLNEKELVAILKEYGQERNARAISHAIIREKPSDTEALADLIKRIVGPRRFIKAAARVFQAIRIYVNRELDELRAALAGATPLLAPGGRIAVISYHSLEDGIVKRQFLLDSGKCFCGPNVPVCVCGKRSLLRVMTKKPLTASGEEIGQNPRARAARLRYAERI